MKNEAQLDFKAMADWEGWLYQIRSHNPLLMSSGRDVPAERLYKVMRVDQKAAIKPKFGITSISWLDEE